MPPGQIRCGNHRFGEEPHYHPTTEDVRRCFAASRGQYSEAPQAARIVQPDWSRSQREREIAGIPMRRADESKLDGPKRPFNWEYADVPATKYALRDEKDPEKISFYEVSRPEDGNWAGATFISVLASDERFPIRGAAGRAVLARIKADTEGAMRLYGQEIGVCSYPGCGRTLTSEWRKEGIGPVCVKKLRGGA